MSKTKKKKQQDTIDGISVKWLDWAPYAITEDGRVYSRIRWRWLHLHKKPSGYIVTLITPYEGEAKIKYIHRLVAELYIPNPDDKSDVDHIDNDPSNNHYKNLQWVTHKENISLSYSRDGRTVPKGEKHWLFGKQQSDDAKTKMSLAKTGVNHPKFKGWYIYKGFKYPSLNQLAEALGMYTMKAHRMFKKGEITFEDKV